MSKIIGIKTPQASRKGKDTAKAAKVVAHVNIVVRADETSGFDASGSLRDVVSGILTAAANNVGFGASVMLAAAELAEMLGGIETIAQMRAQAVNAVNATAQNQQDGDTGSKD
jgi:hypothetical protein